MNRLYTQFQYSLEKRVVNLWMKAAIGSTGAPTISAAASKGVTSIARNSAGKYTITLDDKYVDLLGLRHSLEFSSGDPSAAGGVVLRSQAVSTAKTIVVEFLDETGAAVELSNGVVLRMKFELKASSV
jgi:hypothetical protein